MGIHGTAIRDHWDVTSLADGAGREVLQVIVESVTEMVGYRSAVLDSRVGDRLVTLAAADAQGVMSEHLGAVHSVEDVYAELARGVDLGGFVYVDHRAADKDLKRAASGQGASGQVGTWHSLDQLMAPLHDEHGDLIGVLWLDVPIDQMAPEDGQRNLLATYADQAGHALRTVRDREALAERVRMATTATELVRAAARNHTIKEVMEQSKEPILHGFNATSLWLQTLDRHAVGLGGVFTAEHGEIPALRLFIGRVDSSARQLWGEQATSVLGQGERPHRLPAAEHDAILRHLGDVGISALMAVPLGAWTECLGLMVLMRANEAPRWTDAERGRALAVGQDLGAAILRVRTYEREQQLAARLRLLEEYKNRLVATVAHELKNPLAAVLGHAEMLELSDLDPTDQARLDKVELGALKLDRVVDDLLVLSRLAEGRTALRVQPVDLVSLISGALTKRAVSVTRAGMTLDFEAPERVVRILADPIELARAVTRLIDNAVNHAAQGGQLVVLVRDDALAAEVSITDSGPGIDVKEQEAIFTEFYRAPDTGTRHAPGSGLGLAIVRKIAEAHGGHIGVDSAPGCGSTFRLRLPRHPEPGGTGDVERHRTPSETSR